MKIDFSDYITITEKDILEINREGIKYTGGFIDFSECAANFKEEHGGSGKCVGERDITGSNPSFGFYTAPLTTHIFFIPKGKLSEFISKSSTYERFHDMQKKIIEYGYTTRDMS
jgi:hypothetical protein